MRLLKIIVIALAALVAAANIMLTVRHAAADTTPPVLTVDSQELELDIAAESAAYLQGITASDNRDGDLTSEVFVEHISQLTGKDTVQVTYGVFDQAGNSATAVRTIRFRDYHAPSFSLLKPLRYSVGSVVTLKDRLVAEDCLDGDISGSIRIINSGISNDTEGIYHIRVQATNSLGDTCIMKLPVMFAYDTSASPVITLTDYIVYLKAGETFDPEVYIDSIKDPAANTIIEKSEVSVESDADLSVPGIYDVIYSYNGVRDDTAVILTLVVEA